MIQKTLKALLLLDLVGSTRFIEIHGSTKAAEVFFNHDKLCRTLIYRFKGREIDKTDGFLIIFDRTIDAVNFALAYQLAIPCRTGLQARIGVHWGEVVLKRNEDVFVKAGAKMIELEGMAKPIGARIMSLAGGGQILLSNDARSASEGRTNAYTPKNAHFKVLGKYKLKGVKKPMLVHAVGVNQSDFRLPEENSKVRRVSRPPRKQVRKDMTKFDVVIFFTKCFCFYVIFTFIITFLQAIWSDNRDITAYFLGVDLTWVAWLKELIMRYS
jgi:class 3 adenylate cyclase